MLVRIKNLIYIFVLIISLLALSGCGGDQKEKSKDTNEVTPEPKATVSDNKVYNWDLYTFAAANNIMGEYLIGFADEVKKKTDGRLIITVRTAGELPYKAQDALTIASNGSVQLADANTGYIAGESNIAGLTTVPFLIAYPEEYKKAYDILLPYFEEEIKPKGLEVLFWYNYPHSCFWGKGESIDSLRDLKGQKIRGQNAHTAELLLRLGASTVNLSTPEVASAMQRGIADGMMTSALSVYTSKWHEFLDWGFLCYTGGGWDYVVVNSKALQELPDDLQKTLKETAKNWHEKMFKEINDLGETYPDKLKELGMKIVTPNANETEYGVTVIKSHWDSWSKQAGPNVYEAYNKVREALNK